MCFDIAVLFTIVIRVQSQNDIILHDKVFQKNLHTNRSSLEMTALKSSRSVTTPFAPAFYISR